MAWWQWLIDAAGVLLLLALLYGLALVVRRRVISRHGGTFELSCRVNPHGDGRGWVLGLGRYSGERLEWFRVEHRSVHHVGQVEGPGRRRVERVADEH
ncbi:MAG: DUF2550 domain-containing protein, partial [Actinobacteria bacterium]|nr:DUF2550 domain-containing protein [Actinomycetota bacterium]